MNNSEKTHQCKENSYKDVVIRYEKINIKQWSWVLESTWEETKSEVDGGLANDEEVIIHSDTVLISFCPFCGENLTVIQDNTWKVE